MRPNRDQVAFDKVCELNDPAFFVPVIKYIDRIVLQHKALCEGLQSFIISSSGMMTGGRILHHLYHRLPNPQDTVVVAGYQAEGTRGRKLVDKDPTIRIFGQDIPVRCKVANMTSLSGHADKEELIQWMKNFKKPPKLVFTVHGEKNHLDAYTKAIKERMGWNVIQPFYLESVSLFQGI